MRYLLPLLCTFLLTSCETEEVYELATSNHDFIELEIDGEKMLMNARPQLSSNYYWYDGSNASVDIAHSTPDHLHSLELSLSGCDFGPADAPLRLGTKADNKSAAGCSAREQGVTISYTTFELGGSPGCPHLEGTPTQLSGTVSITEWSADGRVVGTFETDRTTAHDYTLRGRFETTLE